MGNSDAALELVSSMLGAASESTGVERLVPLLERLQGHALLLKDDLWGARDALEASLASAKERHDFFETTLTGSSAAVRPNLPRSRIRRARCSALSSSAARRSSMSWCVPAGGWRAKSRMDFGNSLQRAW